MNVSNSLRHLMCLFSMLRKSMSIWMRMVMELFSEMNGKIGVRQSESCLHHILRNLNPKWIIINDIITIKICNTTIHSST